MKIYFIKKLTGLLIFVFLLGLASWGCFFTNPEDISDFPDGLPNNFLGAACPSGFPNTVQDLSVVLTSPDAPLVEVDGNPTIKLVQGDLEPKTVYFEVSHIDGETTIPRDTVDFDIFHLFLTGLQYKSDGIKIEDEDIPQVFSQSLLPAAWFEPPLADPILTQGFIPGHVNEGPKDPNPTFSEFGLEGCVIGVPPCPTAKLRLGVHLVAVYFVGLDDTLHCTKYSMSIIVCPVVGFEGICG